MRTLLLFLSLLIVIIVIEVNVDAAETKPLLWKIKNPTWSSEFEVNYQNFIHTLGLARKQNVCTTIDQCLKSQIANPMYAGKNPASLDNIFSDCADLPFVLRAYYAWMNDLPYSYPTDLVANSADSAVSSKESDIRYSKYGNIITEKSFVRNGSNINRILQDVVDSISTGSFRTNPSLNDTGELFRDTYSVDIDRKYIVPGTVVYDPNGHIAVVYEVTDSGQVHMIDSHPDNTLTTITYGEKFPRSSLKIGGGFSNFRPFSVDGGLSVKSNAELPGYSLIQYQKAPFIFKDKVVSYYEYVRLKLANGDIIYDPLTEFSDQMDELCLDTKYREDAINVAIKTGVDQRDHPDTLPANIYGADGEWEAYSTPARDARLKAMVRGTRDYLAKIINGYAQKKIKIKYSGNDLVKDLREIYLKKTAACHVQATPSRSLSLDEVLVRLFDLSFDPYHCALLRWGIDDKSCAKHDWYLAEQGLRNRVDVDYNLKTDYDVNSLPSAPASQMPRADLSFDSLLQISR